MKKCLELSIPQLQEALNNLAGLEQSRGRLPDAELLRKQALSIQEKSLGLETAAVARTLNDLGDIYLAQGKTSDAEQMYSKALVIKEKVLGPASPELVVTLDCLADLYSKQRRFDQAERLYHRVLAISEKSFGQDSPDLITILNKLVQLYRTQNNVAQADPLVKRVNALKDKSRQAQLKTIIARSPATGRSAGAIDRPVDDKWALVIGISKFKDPKINLKYASKDAMDFYRYLIGEGNFAADHIKVLLDEKATRENILSYLGDSWLPRSPIQTIWC